MLTKTVDVSDSQARLAELLVLVLSGTEIVFTRDQMPLARLIPIASPKLHRAWQGCTKAQFGPAMILMNRCQKIFARKLHEIALIKTKREIREALSGIEGSLSAEVIKKREDGW